MHKSTLKKKNRMAVPKRKKKKNNNNNLFKLDINRFRKIYEPPRRLKWSALRLIKRDQSRHQQSQDTKPMDFGNIFEKYTTVLYEFRKETEKLVSERGPKQKYINFEGSKINKKTTIRYRKIRDKIRQKQRKNDRRTVLVNKYTLRLRLEGYHLSRLGFGKAINTKKVKGFNEHLEYIEKYGQGVNKTTIRKDRTYLRPIYNLLGCPFTKKLKVEHTLPIRSVDDQTKPKKNYISFKEANHSDSERKYTKKHTTPEGIIAQHLKLHNEYVNRYATYAQILENKKITGGTAGTYKNNTRVNIEKFKKEIDPVCSTFFIKKKLYNYHSRNKCHMNVKRH